MTAAKLPEYHLIRSSDRVVLDRVRMDPEEAAARNARYQQAAKSLCWVAAEAQPREAR